MVLSRYDEISLQEELSRFTDEVLIFYLPKIDEAQLRFALREARDRWLIDEDYGERFWKVTVPSLSVELIDELDNFFFEIATVQNELPPSRLLALLTPFIRENKIEKGLDFLFQFQQRKGAIDIHDVLDIGIQDDSLRRELKGFDSDERLQKLLTKHQGLHPSAARLGLERPSIQTWVLENAYHKTLFELFAHKVYPLDVLNKFITIQLANDSNWANLEWLPEELENLAQYEVSEGLENLLAEMIKRGIPVVSKLRSLYSVLNRVTGRRRNDEEFLNFKELVETLIMIFDSPYDRSQQQEAMVASQELVRKRANELEEEEMRRKRARRQSDPKTVKCMHMNQTCQYTPLDLEDWCEHDENLYYGPDSQNRCWDAEELLKHFESQMLTEKYGNPFPQYPTDPWTRQLIPLVELVMFERFCSEHKVPMNGIAPTFVSFLEFLKARPDMDQKPIVGKWLEEIVDKVL